MKKLIVAIDGPSGVGKSTLSKKLATELDYVNIDTGAMYRCVALAVKRAGIRLDDRPALRQLIDDLKIKFNQTDSGNTVFLNNENVSEAIRRPEVSQLTPLVAALPDVRQSMVARQREMGVEGGVVLEGRDIGTVVFPQAEVKFFMVASADERGRRRYEELIAKGVHVDLEQTIRDIEIRDMADSERELSPLVRAADAVEIDTNGRGIDEVFAMMLATIQTRLNRPGSS